MKLTTYSSLLGLLGVASAFPTPQDASRVEAAAAIKVMPFGASIVEGGCWRAYVQKQLRDAGVTNFDMVGGQTGPNECKLNGVVVDFDKNNEGHSGRLAQQYVVNNELPPFLNAANPQIIIMHLGTNDIKADRTTAQIIGDYTTLLNQMRAKNPNVQLLLMTLIPLRASNNEARWVAAVPTLNTAIAAWAFANTKSNSPITLVDPFTGFNADTMTADGTHPNEAGNKLMADRLFAPLRDALKVRS